jgi:hypothetical protein
LVSAAQGQEFLQGLALPFLLGPLAHLPYPFLGLSNQGRGLLAGGLELFLALGL